MHPAYELRERDGTAGALGDARLRHGAEVQNPVQLLLSEEALLQDNVPERPVLLQTTAWRSPRPGRSPISGASTVASAAVDSAFRRQRALVGLDPRPRSGRRTRGSTEARIRMDSSRLWAMTGIITLSSKLPRLPTDGDRRIVADHLRGHLVHRLRHHRVHLARHDARSPAAPPGARSRRSRSAGPTPSQRMSLAIFMRLTASVLSAPLASTTRVPASPAPRSGCRPPGRPRPSCR